MGVLFVGRRGDRETDAVQGYRFCPLCADLVDTNELRFVPRGALAAFQPAWGLGHSPEVLVCDECEDALQKRVQALSLGSLTLDGFLLPEDSRLC